MSEDRFDRLADGGLLPQPHPFNGFDIPECERRARFISFGSPADWSRWCWIASKNAAEIRRIVAADRPDLDRLRVLLERVEDLWRVGVAARRPRDPDVEYRSLVNQLRVADGIAAAREALSMEPVCDVPVEGSWLAGSG